jgi:hypothetical protein
MGMGQSYQGTCAGREAREHLLFKEHILSMRTLLGWLLATTLWAGATPELPQPGRDPAFILQIMGNSEGGRTPWHTFHLPPITASAVVEVVGYLTPEERRESAFQEFLVWFYDDLHKFLANHGGGSSSAGLASATMPVDRFGGNPVPRNVPLGSVQF